MLEEPLTRSPSYTLPTLHRSFFEDPFFQPLATARPAVDITEEAGAYRIEADLPGVKKENVEVRIGDGGRSVTIEGKIVAQRLEDTPTEGNAQQSVTDAEGKFVFGYYTER
jgi:HSP20 family molecular chaperone IbpA